LVARHTKVFGIANVGAELDLVVPLGTGPVIDELELLLVLLQGAIAAGNIEAIAKIRKYTSFTYISVTVLAEQKAR